MSTWTLRVSPEPLKAKPETPNPTPEACKPKLEQLYPLVQSHARAEAKQQKASTSCLGFECLGFFRV